MPPRYLPTLDGWRAIAITTVILYHGREAFFAPSSRMFALAGFGYLGVSAFFAISGFLICSRLLRELKTHGKINLGAFYVRRIFRIFPPFLLAAAAIVLLSDLGFIPPLEHWELPGSLLFVRNYLPTEGAHHGIYTGHFWSLAVEEHFYLLWPAILFFLRPAKAGRLAAWSLVVFAIWRLIDSRYGLLSTHFPDVWIQARTDCRLDSLFAGCLAAIVYPQAKRVFAHPIWAYAWMPLLALTVIAVALPLPFLTVWLNLLFPALLMATTLHPHSAFGKLLELRPVRWIGTLSYSLYLWQQIVMEPLAKAGSPEMRSGFAHLQHWPLNVIVALAAATASYYLIEKPMMRKGHQISARMSERQNLLRPRIEPVVVH